MEGEKKEAAKSAETKKEKKPQKQAAEKKPKELVFPIRARINDCGFLGFKTVYSGP